MVANGYDTKLQLESSGEVWHYFQANFDSEWCLMLELYLCIK